MQNLPALAITATITLIVCGGGGSGTTQLARLQKLGGLLD